MATAEEELLATADLVVVGRMPWSSNATFLCELWPAGTRPDAGLGEDEDEDEPTDAEPPVAAPTVAQGPDQGA